MFTEPSALPESESQGSLDIEELFRLYGNDVLRVCTVYLGKRSLAEDAFQDVFVRIFRKGYTYRSDTPVKYWILAITRNVCRDYLRSSWLTRIVSFDAWKEDRTAKDEAGSCRISAEGREEERVIARIEEAPSSLMTAVYSLPSKLKDVVLLRFYYDLSNGEIASQLNITEGAVRTRLFRARKVLAPFSEGEDFEC